MQAIKKKMQGMVQIFGNKADVICGWFADNLRIIVGLLQIICRLYVDSL